MNSTPFLSVIMPVYNAEHYVKQAVESVLSQTFKELEIICVNDASKDASLSVLLELQRADSRVKVIDSPENVGAGEARNLGLESACGTYITFMDADDTIEPDLYQRAVDMAKGTDVDEVVWGLIEEHYDVKDRRIRTVPIIPRALTVTEPTELTKVILELEQQTLFGYQWNSFYRADVIRKHHIRFEKSLFYEDYFFNLEFAKHMCSLTTMDFAGYHYFKRVNGSITHQFTKDYFDLSYRRVQSMYAFCSERDYQNAYMFRVLGNKLLRYTLSAICRNFNKQSGMDGKDRKQWFLSVCDNELYRQLLPKCKPSNIVYACMKFAIEHRLTHIAMLMGKMIQWVS